MVHAAWWLMAWYGWEQWVGLEAGVTFFLFLLDRSKLNPKWQLLPVGIHSPAPQEKSLRWVDLLGYSYCSQCLGGGGVSFPFVTFHCAIVVL